MATSISYNSLSLQDTTYRTEKIEHLEMPRRNVNVEARSRRDGQVFVSGFFGSRRIRVRGHIVAASASALKTALDALQAKLNSEGATLDIGYGGGTRRYANVVVERQDIPKESYHYTFVPFDITFLVPSGVGEDTTATTEDDAGLSSSPITQALTLTGSADPLPVITITVNSATAFTILKVKNDTTGEEIIVGPTAASFAALDEIEIDCENMTVKLNGTEKDFTGVFPTWQPGSNTLRITTVATAFNLDWEFVYTPRYL